MSEASRHATRKRERAVPASERSERIGARQSFALEVFGDD